MNKNRSGNYDLEERTAVFGEKVIQFCLHIKKNEITRPLITQLVKASTSVGANYSEADDAESGKDFKHKIGICKKEARESKHFLRMIAVLLSNKEQLQQARNLWNEAKELNLIFNAIYRKVGQKKTEQL